MMTAFEYRNVRLGDFGFQGERNDRTGRLDIERLVVNDESLVPTQRFWKSFALRYGINSRLFRYFEPEEVFKRIASRSRSDDIQICIERAEDNSSLLAISPPGRECVRESRIRELVQQYGAEGIDYANGVVTSRHRPPSSDRSFQIGGDEFENRFVLETPVDGFGQPRLHLSLLRLICANGAIGYHKAFRSMIGSGKDMVYVISRALQSFDNGEGYAALRQRFESAQQSWASVNECHELYKILVKLDANRSFKSTDTFRKYSEMTGDIHAMYGLANLDALNAKRQRVLPAKCRVYDLLNFASEIGTHHANGIGNRMIQSYIGSLVSDEYDMEGTAKVVPDFKDLFLSN